MTGRRIGALETEARAAAPDLARPTATAEIVS